MIQEKCLREALLLTSFESGSLPSVDRPSFQHLVCLCVVFHRSLLLKNPQETQISKSWWSSFSILLNEFPALSFGGIDVGSTDVWVSLRWICRKFIRKFIDVRIRSSFPRWTLAFCKLSWSTDGNDPHSAWPWQWRANNLNKTESPSKICMCGVSTQQLQSTQITLFEMTRQSAWLDAVMIPLTTSKWILVY